MDRRPFRGAARVLHDGSTPPRFARAQKLARSIMHSALLPAPSRTARAARVENGTV
jgi:hypothetical protein